MKALRICMLAISCAVASGFCCSAFAQSGMSDQEKQLLDQMRASAKAQGMTLTPEMEQQMLQRYREVSVGMLGMQMAIKARQQASGNSPASTNAQSMPSAAVGPSSTPSSMAVPSASDLTAQLQALNAPGAFVVFEPIRDGFKINGQPYIDPDGEVVSFAGDGVTGQVGYLVATSTNRMQAKLMNARKPGSAIVIGDVLDDGGRVSFNGRDGRTANGSTVLPTSRGIALAREASIIVLDYPGQTIAKALPSGFHTAQFQNGDVASTRMLLIEKSRNKDDLAGSARDFLKDFGIGKGNDDYAFFNIDMANFLPLHFSRANNEEQADLLNSRTWDRRREVIYNRNGQPNIHHYFWNIQWGNTAYGPLAIVKESALTQVNVINLKNGTRHCAFRRAMGIVGFNIVPTPTGDLEIHASWSFQDHPALASEVLMTLPIE